MSSQRRKTHLAEGGRVEMAIRKNLRGSLGMRGEAHGWHEARLGDVIELKRGYDLPQQQRRPGRVAVVSSSGPSGFHSEAKVKAPGVVTGRYGTIGQVFYVAEDFWPLNTTLYVRDFKGNDPKFISYLLRTIDFLSCSDKAAVPGVNRNHLHELNVVLPPLSDQRAIANILGTLDDKIELNRQTNETLEAMARALFKSWFIDFDPVRAKAEGRQPSGMDAETAKLFPSEFVESELGEIPKGWRAGYLEELQAAEKNAITAGPFGSKLGRSDYVEDGVPVIRGGNLGAGPGEWFSERDFVYVSPTKVERELAGCIARRGDVLFTQRGTLGQVGMVPFDADHERHVISQSQMKMTCSSDVPPEFVVLNFKRGDAIAYIKANAVAAGVPHINLGFLRRFPLVVPPQPVLKTFGAMVRSIQLRMRHNVRECHSLSVLRDVLLPRLLSGELPVGGAERVLEAQA